MKHIQKLTILVLTSTLFTNCAAVKLADSWSSANFAKTKNDKLLVVARTSDAEVRKSYEDQMVLNLKQKEVNAVASYIAFPELKENKNRTEEEVNEIVQRFLKDGFESIMLTSLKEVKKLEKNYTTPKIDIADPNYGKYGIGFTSYYSNFDGLPDISRFNSKENQELVVPLSSTIYILEAVTYDLTVPDKDRLVRIISVEATDPESAKQVRTSFSKIVAKEFGK
ncbi:hypothetical protein ABN763_16635 [Spongiivirga sp. MCCC 1A20706]|uniref:hypothetical protein n=1 Tax=Spongiivirga sp. MCCC 1A20706 TaxID=3160963 RepID=UPI00397791BC